VGAIGPPPGRRDSRLHLDIEIVGKALSVEGQDVREVVQDFVVCWYTKFAEECDREASRI
jgi:hypothetical protein